MTVVSRKIQSEIAVVLFVVFVVVSFAFANDYKWERVLFNSFHFDETGDKVLVDLELGKKALKKGADPNWVNFEKKPTSILSNFVWMLPHAKDAVEYRKGLDLIKILLRNGAVLQKSDGAILFFPISFGQYEVAKLLLENGASATSWSGVDVGSNITPMELAAESGHDEIIDLLVSYGAQKISYRDAIQYRFVNKAKTGDIMELKSLLEKSASVNIPNRQKKTALINALALPIHEENYETVLFLLNSGADVNQKGKGRFGETTPLHQTIWFFSAVLEKEEYAQVARKIFLLLLQQGALVSEIDEDGRTPLHIAANYNNVFAATKLLELKAKVMARDDFGKTPLDYAKSTEMIRLLKDNGAKE